MPTALRLALSDFQDLDHWRWVLSDAAGSFLADHPVALDPQQEEHAGFADLPHYLDYQTPSALRGTERLAHQDRLLAQVGRWLGEQVLGGLRPALQQHLVPPATVVRVAVPPEAAAVAFRPLELAYLGEHSLAAAGLRLVYEIAGGAPAPAKDTGGPLRLLGIFSLPDDTAPLNLRRERYALQQLVEQIVQTQGLAVELRLVQYGATRATLRDALQDYPGWDVVHFSGHGLEGRLVLENDDGSHDVVEAEALLPLLQLTQGRLKLLVLSTCLSGAAGVQDTRAPAGLEAGPLHPEVALAGTALPSLAQELAAALGCAALAMRYPVGDEFATRLLGGLYGRLLGQHQPLPQALQLALAEALEETDPLPLLAAVTPVLIGAPAADLRLAVPKAGADFSPPVTGLFAFPPAPARFVGRLGPMLRATQALAPQSPLRGVLFYGMAGAGKTACALELAYRHERGRFTGYAWHKAPDEGADIQTALADFLLAIETQLDMADAALAAYVDEPARFARLTLPRFKGLLQQHAILVVLDNVGSLLTSAGSWRDPLWGQVVATMLAHAGTSRLVLTSRRLPQDLAEHRGLLREAIDALTPGESAALVRELPHLALSLAAPEGQGTLWRVQAAAQGYPQLLELADALAERGLLPGLEGGASFPRNEPTAETANLEAALAAWRQGPAATLAPGLQPLVKFLARLEKAGLLPRPGV